MAKMKMTTARIVNPQPEALRTSSTERAFNTFLRSVGRDTTRANEQELARLKAIADTMPAWLGGLDEDALIGFFYSIEAAAGVSNRRKIATHPLRPEAVDELHAEDEAQAQKEAEEQRKREEKAQAKPEPQAAVEVQP